ncbi:hypothetical protein LQZ21_02665 [Treponema sp. TIM-1]|uniref:hypothetical protein n=1 Tax=Treponema sp. TIM-1 TaxID=2898417 RepID=UPI00397FCBAD
MNDMVPERLAPADVLAKQGVAAVGGIAGGILLFIMGALPLPLGIAAGVIVALVGVGALFSKDPEDRKPGMIVTAAGFLAILARLPIAPLKSFAGFLLGIGAVGLLAMGIWKGIKFLKGLKSRS